MSTTGRKRLSRQESQIQTRERLIEAARRLFLVRGFSGTSLREIAEDAGYSQGAFYSNFPSKEAVLLELLTRQIALQDDHLAVIVDKEGHSADEILAEIEVWLQELVKDRDLSILSIEFQLHALRSAAFAESYARVWQEHLQRGAVLLTRLFERFGKTLPAPPDQLVAGIMAMSNGLLVQESVMPTHRIAATVTLFVRAIIDAGAERN